MPILTTPSLTASAASAAPVNDAIDAPSTHPMNRDRMTPPPSS
jgi:hypothetical protein